MNPRPSVLETDALPTELLPSATRAKTGYQRRKEKGKDKQDEREEKFTFREQSDPGVAHLELFNIVGNTT